MDALVVARRGDSIFSRARWRVMQVFLISSIFWWAFEGLNIPVQNWHYILDQPYSPLAYFLIASINFSTVLPAVMETAEFLSSFKALRPRCLLPRWGRACQTTPSSPLSCWVCSACCCPGYSPRYCFGLIWLCLGVHPRPSRQRASAQIGAGAYRCWRLALYRGAAAPGAAAASSGRCGTTRAAKMVLYYTICRVLENLRDALARLPGYLPSRSNSLPCTGSSSSWHNGKITSWPYRHTQPNQRIELKGRSGT